MPVSCYKATLLGPSVLRRIRTDLKRETPIGPEGTNLAIAPFKIKWKFPCKHSVVGLSRILLTRKFSRKQVVGQTYFAVFEYMRFYICILLSEISMAEKKYVAGFKNAYA